MKRLRKNKKGFTLVEVIVVLLIIGILLAITIPSIMGYVGQAKEAQYIAEGRSAYVASQTILAKEVADMKKGESDEAAIKTQLEALITPNAVAKELGEIEKNNDDGTGTTVKEIKCSVNVPTTGTPTLVGCSIQTFNSNPKIVNFTAGTAGEAPKTEVTTEATYK